jgi:predicted unusual protein kinase regulating ubiquinone biosynthesis (AarF/ABC1/UbiB family)
MTDDLNDSPQLFKKIKRNANLSGSALGLATKLAGERFLGLKIDRDVHSEELMQILGGLKGPIMKVGQILATIPDALPPEYARAFQELQSNAPSMGPGFVRRRMKSELGVDWQDQFDDFPLQAVAAASLGQVHKAVTKQGQVVACKLQYPDMASAVDADLRQLKLLFKVYKQYDSSIITDDIHTELADRLQEELDYTREAQAQKLYGHLLKDENNVDVPVVIDDLSTDRLLTTAWVDGRKITEYMDSPLEDRNRIALNLFKAWYIPLYKTGVIHGDPHPGNYTVRDDLSINLLDFGCVRIFRPEFVGAVIDLYNALKHDDRDLAVKAYQTWGFGELSNEMIDVLNIWAGFLYGPILDDKTRTIGETNNGVYGREKAQEVHAKLRELRAGVPVPREFVFMDRAALGLGSIFIRLQAEVNWYQLFNEMIDGFDVENLRAAQIEKLPKFNLEPAGE